LLPLEAFKTVPSSSLDCADNVEKCISDARDSRVPHPDSSTASAHRAHFAKNTKGGESEGETGVG
jgi:hypothetical protein